MTPSILEQAADRERDRKANTNSEGTETIFSPDGKQTTTQIQEAQFEQVIQNSEVASLASDTLEQVIQNSDVDETTRNLLLKAQSEAIINERSLARNQRILSNIKKAVALGATSVALAATFFGAKYYGEQMQPSPTPEAQVPPAQNNTSGGEGNVIKLLKEEIESLPLGNDGNKIMLVDGYPAAKSEKGVPSIVVTFQNPHTKEIEFTLTTDENTIDGVVLHKEFLDPLKFNELILGTAISIDPPTGKIIKSVPVYNIRSSEKRIISGKEELKTTEGPVKYPDGSLVLKKELEPDNNEDKPDATYNTKKENLNPEIEKHAIDNLKLNFPEIQPFINFTWSTRETSDGSTKQVMEMPTNDVDVSIRLTMEENPDKSIKIYAQYVNRIKWTGNGEDKFSEIVSEPVELNAPTDPRG